MVGVAVPQALEMASDTELKKTISQSGLTKYGQECKKLQVESVLSLLRGKNTFILAATGFGKSRIPELYLNLLTKDRLGNITGDRQKSDIIPKPLPAVGASFARQRATLRLPAKTQARGLDKLDIARPCKGSEGPSPAGPSISHNPTRVASNSYVT
ncbi:ATP-dependent DNA helicase sgs1 [Puccinia graminis f. sp. tritici]|uniref:ATP-dependent DNA helicase sgs1 n=1 Tax=Puccinia graminis f. sp. tritici TaxID=56615 RepID=A0A5B0NCF5_PUCGR|nr:ATP-dependent DNA helicase sgs1 [Puccinia graminis f. sp. tritici]